MYETYPGNRGDKGTTFGSAVKSETRKSAAVARNNILGEKTHGGTQIWNLAVTRFPSGKTVFQSQVCAIS